jgi:hypothetical protein
VERAVVGAVDSWTVLFIYIYQQLATRNPDIFLCMVSFVIVDK